MVLFAAYALAKAVGHYRRGAIGLSHLAGWVAFWAAVGGVVLMPQITQWFAGILGVGRGADATFYIAVVGLSYAYFKLYLKSLEQDRASRDRSRVLGAEGPLLPAEDPRRGESRDRHEREEPYPGGPRHGAPR